MLTRGAISLVLWVAMAGGIATTLGSSIAGLVAYSKGKKAATAERNSHWQTVLARMVEEHAANLRAEQAKVARINADMAGRVLKAQEALEYERQTVARLRGDVAAAVRRHDQLRDAIDAAATGGRAEADDTIAAARGRAQACGRVLAEALQAHEQCSLDAEDLASGVRALRAAWPKMTQAPGDLAESPGPAGGAVPLSPPDP